MTMTTRSIEWWLDNKAPVDVADEYDRLRTLVEKQQAALNQCRMAFAGYVSAQSAIDMIDKGFD